MTGAARLRAKVCEIGPNDSFDTISQKCNYTYEEMTAEDPTERTEVHIGADTYEVDHDICNKGDASKGQVSCVYVIGILGMAQFETHFSTSVKIEGETEYTVMKEGKPVKDEIMENDPKYFTFSIHNPIVTKLTI